MAHVFEDVNYVYWAHELMVNEIVNVRIPVEQKNKKKKNKKTKAPFINVTLRRAIHFKKALFRKYKGCNSSTNWGKV